MLRQDDTEGAFLATERARSRLLLAELGRGPAAWEDWALEERQELKAAAAAYGARAIQTLRNRIASAGLPDPSAINDARERFLRAYDAHRNPRPEWVRPLEKSPISATEAQALVRPGTALLSYFVAAVPPSFSPSQPKASTSSISPIHGARLNKTHRISTAHSPSWATRETRFPRP